MTQKQNLQIDYSNFWQKISQRAKSVKSSGDRPILIIDLDGTLVDYTLRTYKIFQKALQELDLPDTIKKQVDDIKREDYDYFPKTNFVRANIGDDKTINDLTGFWEGKYFINEYLKYDKQIPGAYEFISNILQLGIEIVYLTGRDDQNMGDGTRMWLKENGFLVDGDNRCRLLMKMDLEIENYESKARNGETIGTLGQPVLIIDNEPIELQTMSERFPDANIVLVDMPNSGKPAKLPEDIFKIKDFRKLNEAFEK